MCQQQRGCDSREARAGCPPGAAGQGEEVRAAGRDRLYSLWASQSTQWELPLMFLMDCRAMASFWLVRRDCRDRHPWAAGTQQPQRTQLSAEGAADPKAHTKVKWILSRNLKSWFASQGSFGISQTFGLSSLDSNRGKSSLRMNPALPKSSSHTAGLLLEINEIRILFYKISFFYWCLCLC